MTKTFPNIIQVLHDSEMRYSKRNTEILHRIVKFTIYTIFFFLQKKKNKLNWKLISKSRTPCLCVRMQMERQKKIAFLDVKLKIGIVSATKNTSCDGKRVPIFSLHLKTYTFAMMEGNRASLLISDLLILSLERRISSLLHTKGKQNSGLSDFKAKIVSFGEREKSKIRLHKRSRIYLLRIETISDLQKYIFFN